MTTGAITTHTRLVLVRHGEASGNREMRYLGSTDAPLTERGRAQAILAGRALIPYDLSIVYTSPLARAVETSAAIAAQIAVSVELEAGLRESGYGEWEGLTRAEALAADSTLLLRWEADPDGAPPGGESLRETQRRAVACASALAARHPSAAIALVSHVGPVKALVCHALGIGPEAARRMWLDPAGISVVDWPLDPARLPILRQYNSVAHLEDGVRWLQRG